MLATNTWAVTADPKLEDLGPLVARIITFLLGIIGSVSIIMLVIGGFRYILAQGDPKSTMSAKATITYALAGLIISLLAVSIVIIIGNTLGVQGLDAIKIGVSTPDQFQKP